MEYYDKAFDRITTRNEKQLKSIKRIFHTVTTTDDPVIRKVPRAARRSANCLIVWFFLYDDCCLSACPPSWLRLRATCLPPMPSWPP